MTGAQGIKTGLLENGVEVVFGIPGVQNLELYNELSFAKIRNILATHEAGASFMADGYARAKGRPGVCLSISGPGLTNMLTGLAEARCDSSPLVVVVSVPSAKDHRAFRLHEVDNEGIGKKVVKEYLTVHDAAEIQSAMSKAFYLAVSGEPGPVIVAVSEDTLTQKIRKRDTDALDGRKGVDSVPDINGAVEMIQASSRIGLYCGGGALEAAEEIKLLAEMVGASVCTTLSGRGAVSEKEENCVGFGDGARGLRTMRSFFKDNDLIIAAGCRFSFLATMGWIFRQPKKIIQIDSERDNIGRNYRVDIAIEGRCEEVLREIIARLGKEKPTPRPRAMDREPGNLPLVEGAKADSVRPDTFFRILREEVSDDALLVTDCGNHQFWAFTDYRVTRPRTFISPVDYQSMGFGIPAAIGAKVARPDAPVICVTGDGGFLMSGFEILTALKEAIKVIFVVFNDGHLGLIRDVQKKHYGYERGVALRVPDLKALSASFGISYFEIVRNGDIQSVMRTALEREESCLVNVTIRYEKLNPYITQTYWNTFLRLPFSAKVQTAARIAKGRLKRKMRKE